MEKEEEYERDTIPCLPSFEVVPNEVTYLERLNESVGAAVKRVYFENCSY